MKIISHRGYWLSEEEKNTFAAFKRAFEKGYGVETDIRDYEGKIVISHNIADKNCLEFEDFLKLYNSCGNKNVLAINIKADGLQNQLAELLSKYEVKNYFLFDMSVPEMIVYDNMKFKYYTRYSDVEHQCVLYAGAKGVWVDSFYNDDISVAQSIIDFLNDGKEVCYVSPELHGRNYKAAWSNLMGKGIYKNDNFCICTDKPDELFIVNDI